MQTIYFIIPQHNNHQSIIKKVMGLLGIKEKQEKQTYTTSIMTNRCIIVFQNF